MYKLINEFYITNLYDRRNNVFRYIRLIGLFLSLTLILNSQTGCANRRATHVTTTEVRRDEDTRRDSPESNVYHDDSSVEVSKTNTITKEDEHIGFFSILGDIIAWPFHVLGSIL